MDLQMILDALQGIITIACGGLAIYFKFSTKAQTKAKQIAETIGWNLCRRGIRVI